MSYEPAGRAMSHVGSTISHVEERGLDGDQTPSLWVARPLTHSRIPLTVVVLLALSVTPIVAAGLYAEHSIWLTFAALFGVWIFVPLLLSAACHGSGRLLLASFHQGMQRPRWQLLVATPAALVSLAIAMGSYHLLALPLGVDLELIRERLGSYGLTSEEPLPDVSVISWLTLLNPPMEEFFWRLFVFRHLQSYDRPCSRCRRWWTPAIATSLMYAAYHTPVTMLLLQPTLVVLSACGLVALGLILQAVVERFGLLVATGLHASLDVAACMIFADIVWSLQMASTRVDGIDFPLGR